jgi:hypothetical protein
MEEGAKGLTGQGAGSDNWVSEDSDGGLVQGQAQDKLQGCDGGAGSGDGGAGSGDGGAGS